VCVHMRVCVCLHVCVQHMSFKRYVYSMRVHYTISVCLPLLSVCAFAANVSTITSFFVGAESVFVKPPACPPPPLLARKDDMFIVEVAATSGSPRPRMRPRAS